MIDNIAFLGISHLSLVYGAVFAQNAKNTFLYDSDSKLVNELKQGRLSIFEPELELNLFNGKSNILYTDNFDEIKKASHIFIAKDIKTDEKNKSNYSDLELLLEKIISNNISAKSIVIMSQVLPGFCREWQKKIPNLSYFVETLVFGEALKRAQEPERLIIGKEHSNLKLDNDLYKIYNSFGCPIFETNFETAELSKISINLFLASSVTLTNYIAEACEEIKADWKMIEGCLRSDKRLGEHAYLSAGLGLAGGNIERDIQSFQKISKDSNKISGLMNLWSQINDRRKLWPADQIFGTLDLQTDSKVTFLGLSYKKNTNSLKNAPSLVNIECLKCDVMAYDPFVLKHEVPDAVILASSIEQAVCESDAIIVFNDSQEFKDICLNDLSKMRGNLIIDPFCVLANEIQESSLFDYRTLG